jgi:hypothetical protein
MVLIAIAAKARGFSMLLRRMVWFYILGRLVQITGAASKPASQLGSQPYADPEEISINDS